MDTIFSYSLKKLIERCSKGNMSLQDKEECYEEVPVKDQNFY